MVAFPSFLFLFPCPHLAGRGYRPVGQTWRLDGSTRVASFGRKRLQKMYHFRLVHARLKALIKRPAIRCHLHACPCLITKLFKQFLISFKNLSKRSQLINMGRLSEAYFDNIIHPLLMDIEFQKIRLVHAEPTTLQCILQQYLCRCVCRHISLIAFDFEFSRPINWERMLRLTLFIQFSLLCSVLFPRHKTKSVWLIDGTKGIH